MKTELYNIDWRKPKHIQDASRLDHGTILYIEEADPKQPLDHFKWHEEFIKEQERITINFNDPIRDPQGEIFEHKIQMKKCNTLMELKQRISEITGVPVNEFNLKRNMMAREYKEMKATLVTLGMQSGICLKVEKGQAHQEGVYELNIIQIFLNQDDKHDDILFEKQHLFKLVVNPSMSGLEFKHKLLDTYNFQHPDNQLTLD